MVSKYSLCTIMMTVLLEYIDRSQVSTIPYYTGNILNAFNDPLGSKVCWYNIWIHTYIAADKDVHVQLATYIVTVTHYY